MHLLSDPWVQVSTQKGERRWIRPAEVGNPEYRDIVAPRADFLGALYQFLIGLLQVSFCPEDREHWSERNDSPPTMAQLDEMFDEWSGAFHLSRERQRVFLQDIELPADSNHLPVLELLIEAGSDVNRYFNHPPANHGLCERCAALALFTLQTNAPSGGRGIRTSLRGGGPLTTLLLPAEQSATLWQRLWLNIIPAEELRLPPIVSQADVMPWLGKTRTSDAQGIGDTPPGVVHPLQAYWGMPRRILLDTETLDLGECSICGATDVPRYRHYYTRHGGTNYTGPWLHPLTPYSIDAKEHDKPPIPIKGRLAGRGYRDWLGLVLGNDNHQPDAARVIASFSAWKHPRKPRTRLWCFGFEMANMKAVCWYDAQLPVHEVAPERQPAFVRTIKQILDSAEEMARSVQGQVKAARFDRPADRKSDDAVALGFWQSSEPLFYQVLDALSAVDCDDREALSPACGRWLAGTYAIAFAQFEQWALSGDIDGLDLKRVTTARAELAARLKKAQRPLRDLILQDNKEKA
ncbi:type I-E CRISPR-associated protein Cse1/CasA [Pusillimonas sp. TS35]|nr:type I-E CRISPR-associated protein Cse1/CasA [Pusillimonas sp. TS35]